MNNQEVYAMLSEAGFTAEEIARLQQLQQAYVEETPTTRHRRTFGDWLKTASHSAFGESYPEWTIYR